MIHKYWNVRLHVSGQPILEEAANEGVASDEMRKAVRREEERVEEKVLWIWRTLSTFEEKSATRISDMLLHVSNGAYFDGVMAARRFIVHVELLFTAADDLDRLLKYKTEKGGFLTSEVHHNQVSLTIIRSLPQSRIKAPVQESSVILPIASTVTRHRGAEAWSDPRASFTCHRSGALSEAPHPHLLARLVEAGTRDRQSRGT